MVNHAATRTLVALYPLTKLQMTKILQFKSPNISCDSTVIDTGIPKSDGTTLDLEVQDT